MGTYHFINTQIKGGVWQGDFVGAEGAHPHLVVTHLGAPLDHVTFHHDDTLDVWRVSVPIPPALINDGVQTFVVSDAQQKTLTSFTIVAGEPLADDLRAEIALLRGELELLKKAFRKQRHENND